MLNPFSTRKIEIPQTLNINSLRTTSAKTINLDTIRKGFFIFSLKNVLRQCLLLPLSRYCSWEVGQYYQLLSMVQGVKGSTFHWKPKKIFRFYWIYLKSDRLKSLGVWMFLFCFVFFSSWKIEKPDFWETINSRNFKINNLRTSSAIPTCIPLEKLSEFSLKIILRQFYLYCFWDISVRR